MVEKLDYTPPPTIRDFIKDHRERELFYDWIIGPVGSGKTTGIFFKLLHMAGLQDPSPKDGVRRTKAVIVRNTMPQLRDTTIASWNYWFRDGQAGTWKETEKKFTLRFNDVECEVLFRPLDTPDDVARVLSLEISFAIIDEFVQIPRQIVDALSARLGRYKLPDGVKPNIWGMWGSSNPDTEDNWWYDYLHNNLPANAKYFVQPSGLSDKAENLENLPGERGYYTNQMTGKSEAWIKQFIEAEWGYSIAGTPVCATFRDMHISRVPLIYNPHLPLIVGLDPGLAGSALIFGQQDLHGRLNVLGELIQSNHGAERLMSQRLKPYLRKRGWGDPILAPDPAAGIRGQSNERSVVDVLKKHYPVVIETNNRLPIRLDAIDSFTTRLVDTGPALQIDANECPVLIRALKGGWRYVNDPKTEKIANAEPDKKNPYSHPGDAFGYLCRYFQKQTDRELRYSASGRKFVPPRSFGGRSYHVR